MLYRQPDQTNRYIGLTVCGQCAVLEVDLMMQLGSSSSYVYLAFVLRPLSSQPMTVPVIVVMTNTIIWDSSGLIRFLSSHYDCTITIK